MSRRLCVVLFTVALCVQVDLIYAASCAQASQPSGTYSLLIGESGVLLSDSDGVGTATSSSSIGCVWRFTCGAPGESSTTGGFSLTLDAVFRNDRDWGTTDVLLIHRDDSDERAHIYRSPHRATVTNAQFHVAAGAVRVEYNASSSQGWTLRYKCVAGVALNLSNRPLTTRRAVRTSCGRRSSDVL